MALTEFQKRRKRFKKKAQKETATEQVEVTKTAPEAGEGSEVEGQGPQGDIAINEEDLEGEE